MKSKKIKYSNFANKEDKLKLSMTSSIKSNDNWNQIPKIYLSKLINLFMREDIKILSLDCSEFICPICCQVFNKPIKTSCG